MEELHAGSQGWVFIDLVEEHGEWSLTLRIRGCVTGDLVAKAYREVLDAARNLYAEYNRYLHARSNDGSLFTYSGAMFREAVLCWSKPFIVAPDRLGHYLVVALAQDGLPELPSITKGEATLHHNPSRRPTRETCILTPLGSTCIPLDSAVKVEAPVTLQAARTSEAFKLTITRTALPRSLPLTNHPQPGSTMVTIGENTIELHMRSKALPQNPTTLLENIAALAKEAQSLAAKALASTQ